MAQLEADEIKPGLVAHLDQTMLTNDIEVLDTFPQTETELRPFVCIRASKDESTWTPLSSTYRKERLEIKEEWREGGIDMWRDRATYLVDGANVYIGPNTSFIAASSQELTERATRSQMKSDGVAAVRDT